MAGETITTQVYTSVTVADITAILTALQTELDTILGFEEQAGPTGSAMLLVRLAGGASVNLYLSDRSSATNTSTGPREHTYQTLAVGAGIAVKPPASCDAINAWNRRHRLVFAYLDSRGNAILESDLSLAGGVARDAIKKWLVKFLTVSFPDFVTEILG